MELVLPDVETYAKIRIGDRRSMTDDEYFEFCALNRRVRIERTAEGEIVIMPPAGCETEDRNVDIVTQLRIWARKDGQGRALGSNTEFFLPSGAALGPDACWIANGRLDQFTKEQKRKFLRLCPEFIIELTSPSDRLKAVQAKMVQWMENGAQLGWLIDADRRTVYIYRPGCEPEKKTHISRMSGEGTVAGFELHLGDIWEGL